MRGDSLPKSGNFPLLGPRSHPRGPTGVKFCVPLGHAIFHVNWCNESPLRGENADFWLVSKFNTGSFLLVKRILFR